LINNLFLSIYFNNLKQERMTKFEIQKEIEEKKVDVYQFFLFKILNKWLHHFQNKLLRTHWFPNMCSKSSIFIVLQNCFLQHNIFIYFYTLTCVLFFLLSITKKGMTTPLIFNMVRNKDTCLKKSLILINQQNQG